MTKLLCRHAACGSIGQLLLHMMLLRFLFPDSILCRGVPCIHLVKCVRCSVLQIGDVLGRRRNCFILILLSGVTQLSLLPGWWESVNFDKTRPTLGNLFLLSIWLSNK